MPLLRAPPYAGYVVGTHRYTATSAGLLDCAEEDIGALLAAGCIPLEPWRRSAAQAPTAEPEPTRPSLPRVRLRAPRPHMTFAPESGSMVRYTADADGHFEAAPEHVKALVRAGCCVVTWK